MSAPQLFIIRTPVSEVSGLAYGGMLRIRTPLGPAYAAFPDRELAAEVAEFWSIQRRASIEAWAGALADEPQASRASQFLVFESSSDFKRYLEAPGQYPFAERMVPIGPRPIPSAG